ncbi:MAG: transglutaminase domain-containing protein [Clostridiales bacterium]|nr:transglutaminase domain-containing protein [Clostridiales bacterium]
MSKPGKKKGVIRIGLVSLAAVLACGGVYVMHDIQKQRGNILKEITLETGSPVVLEDFLKAPVDGARFYTDITEIDTSVPGSYGIIISFTDFGREFHQDAVLNVLDTTAPTAQSVPQVIYRGELPEASQVVNGIYDLAPVTVSYETAPDTSAPGEFTFRVLLTDASGNTGTVDVPFTIIDDHLAPLIYGAHDIEAFIGDNISYLDGITVTDNYAADPQLTVDNSYVDPAVPGTYPVTYIAQDEVGNVSSVTVELTLRERPARYYEPEVLYELCRELNEQYGIYTEDMTDVEKAFRIFAWSTSHVMYAGAADKTDWTCAAYDGLTTLRGDCYTYYAVNRAFLDMEGIPNMLVERYPVTWSPHYWNLVYLDGAWYHCDSLAFSSPRGYYFMCAVEDLNPFDHLYDESLYGPEINIAQEPVAQYVHYDTLEVDEF